VIALLLAGAVTLQVTTEPPGGGEALATIRCEDGAVSEQRLPVGEAVELQLPCLPALLEVALDGHVPATLRAGGPSVRLAATLLAKATVLVRSAVGGPSKIVWLARDAAQVTREDGPEEGTGFQVGPGSGCLVVAKDEMVPFTKEIELAPGQRAEVTVAAWRRGARLVGTVVDDQGRPLGSGVEVRAQSKADAGESAGESLCDAALARLGFTATAADRAGEFSLGPLGPGRWELEATAPGFSPGRRSHTAEPGEAPITVPPLVLTPISTLEVIVDPARAALEAPFELRLQRERLGVLKKQDRWSTEREVEIGDSLRATIPNLKPGLYRLVLEKADTDLLFAMLIDLPPATTQSAIVRPLPIQLSGTVRQAGRGVPEARVGAVHDGLQRDTTCDEHGAYSLRLWIPTTYLVGVFRAEDSAAHHEVLDLREATEGDTVHFDIDLPASGVEGLVLDREDKSPIASASVILEEHRAAQGSMSRRTVTTDADGRFRFPYVSDDAQAHLEAQAEGYLRTTLPLAPLEGDRPPVVLELERGMEVTGSVLGPGGEPVAGATVGCCPSGGRFLTVSTSTLPDGSFVLSTAVGTPLWAYASGYAIGWAAASRDGTRIVLSASDSPLLLRVLDGAGDPVPFAEVGFSTPDGTVIPSGVLDAHAILHGGRMATDRDGRAVVTGLPRGLYQVWLIRPGSWQPLQLLHTPAASEVALRAPGVATPTPD